MRRAGRLPQLSDPPGRVDEGWPCWRVGHGADVRPREHAGDEQQPGPPKVAPGCRRMVDDDGAAGPACLWVEVTEHALQPVVGQRLCAEGEVCVQETAQTRPV